MILWALPAGVTALAIVATLVVAARVTRELAALQAELGRLRELRIPVEVVRADARAARASLMKVTSR